eukprot:7382629-Prymnesium_polylepis.3
MSEKLSALAVFQVSGFWWSSLPTELRCVLGALPSCAAECRLHRGAASHGAAAGLVRCARCCCPAGCNLAS